MSFHYGTIVALALSNYSTLQKENDMPRIQPIDSTTASPATQKLLAGVQKKLGMVPNLIATMAQSTAVAQAYLSFSQALSGGVVPASLREQIALTVSQANECGYCLAEHSAIGSSVGLSDDQIHDARAATSPDRKTEAVLKFARRVVEKQGFVSNDDIEEIRTAGYSDEFIVEVIGNVALLVFTNYLNHVAETEIDFPAVAELAKS